MQLYLYTQISFVPHSLDTAFAVVIQCNETIFVETTGSADNESNFIGCSDGVGLAVHYGSARI